ncbi:MAG: hypothetical protein ABIG84_02210 [archaeon]
MTEKARLNVYQFSKGKNVPEFKKTLSLPAYLYRQDDFAMFIARNCGCHYFHISYPDSEKRSRRLADIKIKSHGQKQVEYAIPYEEDQHRLILFLERNKKERHHMKETTSAGRKAPDRYHEEQHIAQEDIYG